MTKIYHDGKETRKAILPELYQMNAKRMKILVDMTLNVTDNLFLLIYPQRITFVKSFPELFVIPLLFLK